MLPRSRHCWYLTRLRSVARKRTVSEMPGDSLIFQDGYSSYFRKGGVVFVSYGFCGNWRYDGRRFIYLFWVVDFIRMSGQPVSRRSHMESVTVIQSLLSRVQADVLSFIANQMYSGHISLVLKFRL